MASPKSAGSSFSLDEFVHQILAKKKPHSSFFTPPLFIPSWALPYTHLLYLSKSVPPDFSEAAKLYLCYEGSPSSVKLVGETKDKRRINRELKVEVKCSSVHVKSRHHKDMSKDEIVTFEGRGRTFEEAVINYLAKSDLSNIDYQFTMSHLQKEGDAFLMHKIIKEKGLHGLLEQIGKAVTNIFHMIPEHKHSEIFTTINKEMRAMRKLAHQYDKKLWVIIESICKHFDEGKISKERLPYRDHFISNCCSQLMKGIDITPKLEGYLTAVQMHNVLMQGTVNKDASAEQKKIATDYHSMKLIPEKEGQREKIKDCYDRFIAAKKMSHHP